jgi:hypothetical protein
MKGKKKKKVGRLAPSSQKDCCDSYRSDHGKHLESRGSFFATIVISSISTIIISSVATRVIPSIPSLSCVKRDFRVRRPVLPIFTRCCTWSRLGVLGCRTPYINYRRSRITQISKDCAECISRDVKDPITNNSMFTGY